MNFLGFNDMIMMMMMMMKYGIDFYTHLYCLVGCLSMIGHMLFWVSYMHVFSILAFALVHRN